MVQGERGERFSRGTRYYYAKMRNGAPLSRRAAGGGGPPHPPPARRTHRVPCVLDVQDRNVLRLVGEQELVEDGKRRFAIAVDLEDERSEGVSRCCVRHGSRSGGHWSILSYFFYFLEFGLRCTHKRI
jgi:hypothetical protein